MSYQVLARKWRPQVFEAVVGQDAITRTLRNALAAGRIAHAYLFAGPRGVGKTTTARLLARALLCPSRTGPEPCDACPVCDETRAGSAVDVLEIDGASNRGIDEIRTLRENVKYTPTRGRYKVYIIDEVHQLTEAAFNALLKTLEEPPPHVVFVLATTDPRDVPATVLSRVQRFDFRPIAPETLLRSLERILEEERIPFEPAALPAIVRAADGSLRDALSLLDTAIAYGNGRVEATTVAGLLGTTTPEDVRAFATALLARDAAAAITAVDRAVRDGEDLQAFARDVVELLRRVLVLKAAPTAQLADLTTTEGNELRKLGEDASLDEILHLVRAFLDADTLMRESPHPRVELEIAAVRATRRPAPQALEEVLRRVDEAEQRLRQQPTSGGASPPAASQELLLPPPGGGDRRTGPTVASPRPAGISTPGGGAPGTATAPPASRPSPRAVRPSEAATAAPGAADAASPGAPAPASISRASGRRGAGAADVEVAGGAAPETPDPRSAISGAVDEELATAWQRVIDEVMKRKPVLGGVLMHARAGGLASGELAVVLTGNHFHRETLADRAHRELVLQAIRRHVPGAKEFSVVTETGGEGSVTEHPAVQAAIATFHGEVVAVRPRAPEGDGQ